MNQGSLDVRLDYLHSFVRLMLILQLRSTSIDSRVETTSIHGWLA